MPILVVNPYVKVEFTMQLPAILLREEGTDDTYIPLDHFNYTIMSDRNYLIVGDRLKRELCLRGASHGTASKRRGRQRLSEAKGLNAAIGTVRRMGAALISPPRLWRRFSELA